MIFVKGNLLDLADQGEFDVIVHGCNCLNVMGAGIALSISQRYPQAFEADYRTIREDYNKLGNFTYAYAHTKTDPVKVFTIVNAYTQYTCRGKVYGEDLFEYEAFMLILQKLHKHFGPNTRYGFPLIGCGLAGGNKEVIMDILQNFTDGISKDGCEVTIVELP